jgi:hypothetical protein
MSGTPFDTTTDALVCGRLLQEPGGGTRLQLDRRGDKAIFKIEDVGPGGDTLAAIWVTLTTEGITALREIAQEAEILLNETDTGIEPHVEGAFMYRYYLRPSVTALLDMPELPWTEVTRDQWIAAERGAGFHPKGGGHRPATGGFSGGGVEGRIKFLGAAK